MTSTRYAQRNDTTTNYTPLLPKGVQRHRARANTPCGGPTGPENTPVGRRHCADVTRAQEDTNGERKACVLPYSGSTGPKETPVGRRHPTI